VTQPTSTRLRADSVDWVLPLPGPGDLFFVTKVRGTLLVASRAQLLASGRFAQYERLLAPYARHDLDSAVAASWLPSSLAEEHFRAIDQLEMAETEIIVLTSAAAQRLHGVFLTTLAKMTQTRGLTPWAVVPMATKIWKRLFVGGALGVAREGPRNARVVVAGHPLIKSRYHRLGLGRHFASAIRFVVGKQIYVRDHVVDVDRGRAEYLLQWA
jgi:hypothetical protein